ncbi:hypothetical protein WAI453_010907 [Rhynchosporium graminicola]|uniref:Uncharacterized protein n=1 Tax=Rhynchosporium graminicola TaxID=2792576 RepID=A0A1E1LKZ9_9HELO|nr:uncharacterized protein RCO7_09908 [Rhynchosporium commune]
MGGVRIVPDSKKSEVTETTDEIDTDNKGYSDENETDDEDYMSAKSILSSDDTEPYNEEQMLAENSKEPSHKGISNFIPEEPDIEAQFITDDEDYMSAESTNVFNDTKPHDEKQLLAENNMEPLYKGKSNFIPEEPDIESRFIRSQEKDSRFHAVYVPRVSCSEEGVTESSRAIR